MPKQAPRDPSLLRLIARHPVASFLVMSYVITCSFAFVPFLTQPAGLPADVRLWDPLASLLGCALPAFVVTAAVGSRPGLRDLLSRSLRWQVSPKWYLIAVLALPIATTVCACAFYGLAPIEALVDKWSLLFTLVLPQLVFRLVVLNLAEEIGWMGFLQATLNDRHGSLKASLMAAAPFALWHLPSWMLEFELGLAELYLGLGLVVLFGITHVFARVLLMWFYNNTNKSVLLVALFHSTFNTTTAESGFSGEFIPGFEGAGFFIATGLLIAAAVLVAVLTKGTLSSGPSKNGLRTSPANSAVVPDATTGA
jgi:CAAX protease family protein